MRRPRFIRKWAVRLDLGYKTQGGRIVFASGPFRDRFFWRRSAALAYRLKLIEKHGVPLDRVHVMNLHWQHASYVD